MQQNQTKPTKHLEQTNAFDGVAVKVRNLFHLRLEFFFGLCQFHYACGKKGEGGNGGNDPENDIHTYSFLVLVLR